MHCRECDSGRWAGTKPVKPAADSSFVVPNSTVCCWMDHFTAIFEMFKETPAKELTEAQDTPKNSQNGWFYVSVVQKKNKVIVAKCLLRTVFNRSLMVTDSVSKLGWSNLILIDPGVKSMKSVTVICFCHKSCCPPYIRSLASSSFSKTDIVISEGNIVMCLRYSDDRFIRNFLRSVVVRELGKSVNMWQRYWQFTEYFVW